MITNARAASSSPSSSSSSSEGEKDEDFDGFYFALGFGCHVSQNASHQNCTRRALQMSFYAKHKHHHIGFRRLNATPSHPSGKRVTLVPRSLPTS
jgi:formylglycine-generating enzyme required for sulfatase activity